MPIGKWFRNAPLTEAELARFYWRLDCFVMAGVGLALAFALVAILIGG